MKKFFKGDFLPILIVFSFWFALVAANFTPGTWLSGWDNLHPEFNFAANIRRSLSAGWQEYQGLGLPGGMAHAADLPRQLILLLFSLVFPVSLIRYFWTFLMLLLGPLGVYFLVSRVFLDKKGQGLANLAGLTGALFYLLNLATVQYFFTPFETFTSFFGFFPWLFFFALTYLKKGGRRRLISFFLISVLATPAFYVQTLFVVYLIFLLVFSLESILRKKRTIRRALKLGLVILATNAFWIFPVLYFSLTNAGVLANAKANSIATPETQIMNEARGNFSDIVHLRGYWLDYYDLGETGKFDYLYATWLGHVDKTSVVSWGYVLFGVALLGLLIHLFRKQALWKYSGITLFVIVYFMLASRSPPFGALFNSLSEKIPLFTEIFRNIFTKWSVAAALVYSLGLSFFIAFLASVLKGRLKILVFLASLVFAWGMYVSVRPAFNGQLIAERMRVDLPDEYLKVFEFFKNEPKEARIAHFPIHTFWGWNFYDWGYRGSGFLWYGIEQPILDRAFDVWSPNNETFYNQASFAFYGNDLGAFEEVLKKYQVKYILLDESVIHPGNSEAPLFIPEIRKLTENSEYIRQVASFGFLKVFETDFGLPAGGGDKFVWTPDSFTRVNADLTYAQTDPIYTKYDTYIQDIEGISYPFLNFDRRSEVKVRAEEGKIVLTNDIKEAKASFPTEERIVEDFRGDRSRLAVFNCDLKRKGRVSKENLGEKIVYQANDGGVSCDFFYYPELSYSKGYILRIKGENKQGRGLKIYLRNVAARRMDLEELLPSGSFDEYFFILPRSLEGNGYTLTLETRSFGKVASENVVEGIEFYPVPIAALMEVELDTKNSSLIRNNIKINRVRKSGTAWYKIDFTGSGLLVLGQGYEEGWLAYLVNGRLPTSKLPHVKVNSWANGWIVPEGEHKIVILYWPQVLQYLGFLILIISLALVVDKGMANRLKYPSSPNLSKF